MLDRRGGPSGAIGQGIPGTAANADWSLGGDQAFAFLSAADGGFDFNGDQFDDVVVGIRHYDAGEADEGRILVFRGSASGLEVTPFLFSEPDIPGVFLGTAVGGAGDVDGDGFDDVVAGAPSGPPVNRTATMWLFEGRRAIKHSGGGGPGHLV